MTRAQYQAKYGKAPSVPAQTFNNDAAVPSMTRAEYQAKYGAAPQQQNQPVVAPQGSAKAGIEGLRAPATQERGAQAVQNWWENIKQLPSKLSADVQDAAANLEKGKLSDFIGINTGMGVMGASGETGKGVAKATLRPAGDVATSIYEPVMEAMGATGMNEVFNYLGNLSQVGGKYNPLNLLTDTEQIQDFVSQRPNLEEDFNRALMFGLAAADTGKIDTKTVVPRTIEQFKSVVPEGGTSGAIADAKKSYATSQQNAAVEGVKQEIYNIETNYAKTRKANQYMKDEGDASRTRIAQSGVLQDSVSTDGVLRTKQQGGAIEQYKAKTIDGYEDVVRKNLVREGATVNVAEIEKSLTDAVKKSGLEGDALVTALNGISKEIAGLKLRADPFGNIALEKVHDAKISAANGVNYQTPPHEGTYRKTVARVYKETVENKSKTNVKAVNDELKKYYQDISLLERLDGTRVKGAKLGKYFAALSGNIIGGAAGFALGGPVGGAIGPIIGGEAAGLIKGSSMARTFNKNTGGVVPKSPILEKAKAAGNSPSVRDVTKPDVKVGAASNIPKTKEILKVEAAISKNVEAQKAAIKAKNYPLVDHLKDIYEFLVDQLKKIIEAHKDNRGFVKNPLSDGQSNNAGNRNTQYNKTNAAKSNSISNDSSTQPRLPKSQQFTYKDTMDVKKLVSHEGAPDAQRVLEYRRKIAGGEEIEPIIAIKRSAGTFDIEDGKHRYQAFLEEGYQRVPVKVFDSMAEFKTYREMKETPYSTVKAPKAAIPKEAPKFPEILNFRNPEGITPIKQDGKIVGGIDATVNSSDPQRLDIHHVRIIPEVQGQGLGTQAIKQLFKDYPDVNKLVGHATAESKSFWQKQLGVEFSGRDKNIFTIPRPTK